GPGGGARGLDGLARSLQVAGRGEREAERKARRRGVPRDLGGTPVERDRIAGTALRFEQSTLAEERERRLRSELGGALVVGHRPAEVAFAREQPRQVVMRFRIARVDLESARVGTRRVLRAPGALELDAEIV